VSHHHGGGEEQGQQVLPAYTSAWMLSLGQRALGAQRRIVHLVGAGRGGGGGQGLLVALGTEGIVTLVVWLYVLGRAVPARRTGLTW
jgi:hypothetical protein